MGAVFSLVVSPACALRLADTAINFVMCDRRVKCVDTLQAA